MGVSEQLLELLKESLNTSIPEEQKLEPLIAICSSKFGDYQCNNAMSIWSRIKGRSTDFKNPNSVGKEITKNLSQSDMIERSSVADSGFVNLVLSNSRIVERIRHILLDDISISCSWQNHSYVMKVELLIIDEIHLFGADRGPILEVIVSRMRFISSKTTRPIRFVGLSIVLANIRHLAEWMGIDESGLYNFKLSVRPVPLEVHIQGYPGKFYCPRMNSMDKPSYAAITTHSPSKLVLIFVSFRRPTRRTTLDLI